MIQEENKVVFIHIPKTAGTSMGRALGFTTQCHKTPAMEPNSEHWNKQYFKFAFTRHPFDRFLSAYFYHFEMFKKKPTKQRELIYKTGNSVDSFNYFISKLAYPSYLRRNVKKDLWFRDQCFWLFGKSLYEYDFIGRFERLEKDFKYIQEKLQINLKLTHKNKTKRMHFQNYYTQKSKKIITNLYERDFNFLGYKQS
jgi:chondroitin 4-sulfotransferase 11